MQVISNNFEELELGIYKNYGYKTWGVVVLLSKKYSHKVLRYYDI